MLRALDLFCGAGGATAGLQRAGFDVTGVDITQKPSYPGTFMCTDALSVGIEWMRGFDLIWASPPCQGHTAYKRRPDHVAPVDTDGAIERTRELLERAGKPWIIENVPGAPLRNPLILCGSMFDLEVRRHRWFEVGGWERPEQPKCNHGAQHGNFPQATNRTNPRRTCEIGVWRIPLDVQQRAMGGVGWMNREELSQSIPPAYSEWLAKAFLTRQPLGVSGDQHNHEIQIVKVQPDPLTNV